MDYKEKLEAEQFEFRNGKADMYLYRNNPPVNQIVEQIDPPEGGKE